MLFRKQDNRCFSLNNDKNFLDWVRQFSCEAALSFPELAIGKEISPKHPRNSVSALMDVAVNVFFQAPISAYILRCDLIFQSLYEAMLNCLKEFNEEAFQSIAQQFIKHSVGLALHLMFNENGQLQSAIRSEFQIHQFSFEGAAKQLKEEGEVKKEEGLLKGGESVYIDLLYRKLIGAFLFSVTQGLLLKKLREESGNDSDKARYTEYVNRLRYQQKVFLGLADARESDLKDELTPRMKILLEETMEQREMIKSFFSIEDKSVHKHARAIAVQAQLEVTNMYSQLNRIPKRVIQNNVNCCLGDISKMSQPPYQKNPNELTSVWVRGVGLKLSAKTAALLNELQGEIDVINCMDRFALFRQALQDIQMAPQLANFSELEKNCLLRINVMIVQIGIELQAIPVQGFQKKQEETTLKALCSS
jgi:hypothetical protein